jgi:hypothetical protein
MSLALVFALTLVGASCNKGPDVTLALAKSPPSSVEGNVVSLDMSVTGVKIVKADGDTSGKSGHFHVFIDRDPVVQGDTIPKEAGIVHSAENPIKIYGLSIGEHRFTIVLGDGTHKRIDGDLEVSTTVRVKGPSVDGTAPAMIKEGDDLTVGLKAQGVKLIKPDGSRSKKTGHMHVLVDPAKPPMGGDLMPPPKPNEVIHTIDKEVTISGLTKGEHVLWVVLGDGTHHAFDPPVMDKLMVTVG